MLAADDPSARRTSAFELVSDLTVGAAVAPDPQVMELAPGAALPAVAGAARAASAPPMDQSGSPPTSGALLEPGAPRPRRSHALPFSPPNVGEDEIAAVAEVLRSDWITTGPRVREFERAFAAHLGAPAALALNSCTAGLHTALAALGIGRGDEVITSTMTFAATANVVVHLGARPVLVDVEADTLNLDPQAVEAAITPRTRAVIPVHYAGHPADMDPLLALARRHGLAVVEDAAHALPARYRGRWIGAADHPVAFSFYATKNLTTAEGGMLTGAPAFLERCRVLALHGMSRDAADRYRVGGTWFYEVLAPGFKYNMTDLQAAMGLVQLRRLAAAQQRRREVVSAYAAAFAGEDALELPVERADVESAWHLYPVRLRDGVLRIGRDQLIAELAARQIGTSVHFIPVHVHPYYRDALALLPGDLPVAYDAYRRLVSLPLHPRLGDADVDDVTSAVLDVLHTFRR